MPELPTTNPDTSSSAATTVGAFFAHPILNSPYGYPSRHWELDATGQPTQRIVEERRTVQFITPIPKPKKRGGGEQVALVLPEGQGLSTADQQYEHTAVINAVRKEVDRWRALPSPSSWQVTPETERLLQHWRHHPFAGVRPFFCQVEAVETLIWLTEVAPKLGKQTERFLRHLDERQPRGESRAVPARAEARDRRRQDHRHGDDHRLADGERGAPPAEQELHARLPRHRARDHDQGSPARCCSRTIRTRTTRSRELVPRDLVDVVRQAKIVITNYHAFKLRDRLELSKGGRALLEGRHGEEVRSLETEGQMIQRVMPELMGMKNVLVLNDEAHHCYREKQGAADDDDLRGEEKKEAEQNNEAARLWISGIEAVNRKLGVSRVVDLSATPFFLRGSGYAEGTLFPWTMSDFSLMDAIECGIVKLPRVPIADNIPGSQMPMYRELWAHIGSRMPKKGRGTAGELDPLALPTELQTALEALYGHYEKTFELWQRCADPGAALLHHRLQQHSDVEARLRARLRLPADER